MGSLLGSADASPCSYGPEATAATLHTHTGIPKIATVRLTNSDNLCEILEITLSDVLNCVFKNEKTANGPARVGKSAFYVFSYVKCVMF